MSFQTEASRHFRVNSFGIGDYLLFLSLLQQRSTNLIAGRCGEKYWIGGKLARGIWRELSRKCDLVAIVFVGDIMGNRFYSAVLFDSHNEILSSPFC